MTSEERAKQFLDQAEPTLYAYDLKVLTSQFDQHAAEQREACAYWVSCEFYRKNHTPQLSDYISACLNAVVTEDE